MDTTAPSLPWYRRLNQMKTLLLIIVSMAQCLDIINVSSVTIILPNVMHDVGYKIDQLQWVTSAYALAYGAFLLLGGRLGDLYGHRNIYILGVFWFSVWSVVNGFAKTPVVLSVARAMQGMGAGFTVPSALAILTTTYPVGPERSKALEFFGGTAAVGSVLGMLLGGVLGSTIGWRWMFFITGIIGFSLVILGILVIPAEKGESKVSDRRLDVFGMACFTLGIVGVIYYLSEGPAAGWSAAAPLAILIVGVVLLMSFVVIEHRIAYPIMPLHIWQSRRLIASCATTICMMAGLNAHFFFSSLTFQNVLMYSPLKTSFAYITHGVGSILAVVILGFVMKAVRTKIVLMVGWVFFLGSGVVWAQIQADSSYWSIPFPALILNFVGMASIWLCCQLNSVADAADEDQGVVGAVYNVCMQIGAPIGIAITNIIANSRNAETAVGSELLPGYCAAFYAISVMAGVGMVATLVLAPNTDNVKKPDEANKESEGKTLENLV
ncbi:hypothetical protein BGZ82_001547 [Podila clonocystis]|nr:hypothetical protein BGZ82_001547 [Podila clonocystis]